MRTELGYAKMISPPGWRQIMQHPNAWPNLFVIDLDAHPSLRLLISDVFCLLDKQRGSHFVSFCGSTVFADMCIRRSDAPWRGVAMTLENVLGTPSASFGDFPCMYREEGSETVQPRLECDSHTLRAWCWGASQRFWGTVVLLLVARYLIVLLIWGITNWNIWLSSRRCYM